MRLIDCAWKGIVCYASICCCSYYILQIGLRGGRYPKHSKASIAVIGAGPLGLATVLCAASEMEPGARIFAVDLAQQRLDRAQLLGATDPINNCKGDCVAQIMKVCTFICILSLVLVH